MRLVIIAAGTWGDVRPNVILGQALQKAGYEVLLVTSQDFGPWVTARGLPFVGLSVNIQAILDSITGAANFLAVMKTLRSLGPTTVQMGREITAVIQPHDIILINESGLSLINGAIDKHKVRHIHINMQPFVPTRQFSGMLPPLADWIPWREAYNRWAGGFVRWSNWRMMGKRGNQIRRDELNLPAQSWAKHKALLEKTPSLLLVSPHLLPPPPDWAPHHRVTGFLFDEDSTWQAPPALIDFLSAGEKPIYIGFGSMRLRKPQATTQLILEAVQRSGQRAILLRGWADMGQDDLPDNIFLLDYAPHTWLFPQMTAVVHHGGAGTTAAGLHAGVPSIILPLLADQPFWGQHLYQLGLATRPISHTKLTADKLAAAIQEATTNQAMHDKAQAMSQKIAAEDGLGEALKALEEIGIRAFT